jgi:AbrB family looped-hinge helix DNA binding protein
MNTPLTPQIYRAKISAQGQVTIPSAVRAQIGAEKGTYIRFYIDKNDSIAVTTEHPIDKYLGKLDILGGKDATRYIREMRDKSAERYTVNK